MTNPYRAMCAELVAAWDALPWEYDWLGNAIGAHGKLCDDSAVDRARALLDQPVPQPVPVSERLPGPEDCDAEGRCWGWWTDPMSEYWEYVGVSAPIEPYGSYIPRAGHTHWLPANALPTPKAIVHD